MRAESRRRVVLGAALAVVGCGGLRDDLRRAETAYGDARYEDAQVWTDALARDVLRLAPPDRATFWFVAGMTHLRIGDAIRARHELALCAAQLELSPGALAKSSEELLWRTLRELRP
jgi:hypothetical protein